MNGRSYFFNFFPFLIKKEVSNRDCYNLQEILCLHWLELIGKVQYFLKILHARAWHLAIFSFHSKNLIAELQTGNGKLNRWLEDMLELMTLPSRTQNRYRISTKSRNSALNVKNPNFLNTWAFFRSNFFYMTFWQMYRHIRLRFPEFLSTLLFYLNDLFLYSY